MIELAKSVLLLHDSVFGIPNAAVCVAEMPVGRNMAGLIVKVAVSQALTISTVYVTAVRAETQLLVVVGAMTTV